VRLSPETLGLAVAELAARDPDLAAVVERFGPPPLWARRPGFSTLVRIILEQQVANAIVAGGLDLGGLDGLPDDDVRAALIELPGIGPWTADIYLLMALRRPDVWPNGDLALARALQRVKRMRRAPGEDRMARVARTWAPWRAAAARVLWHFYLSSGRS
jgi:DNA-3-methyladenine glycosylase II